MDAPSILIVGAGPTGLVLALTLLRSGVSPRTLEVYDSLGLHEEVQKRSIAVPLLRQFKLPGGVELLKEFALPLHRDPTPANPYLNFRILGQDSLDKILRAELVKLGCAVELGIELQSLEQSEDGVHVKILHHSLEDDSSSPVEEEAFYKWVIGADGARGMVRKQIGLSFLGETTELQLAVGDLKTEEPFLHRWCIWGEASNVVTVIRPTNVDGLYTFILGGLKLGNATEIVATEQSLKDFIRVSTGGREDIKIKEFVWTSPYKVNIRMVDAFKKGRVLVAGDAGHVHSPTGGQGMNTGVQDAFNLGWKLALVAKGVSPPSLLDTYNEERFPVVAEMLNITTDLMKKTLSSKGDGGWSRGGKVDQLGVNYRWSSIVVNEAADCDNLPAQDGSAYGEVGVGAEVQPGDRAPDAPGLIVVGESKKGVATRLFRLFDPARHTVLIFVKEVECKSVLSSLHKYDRELVRPIIITEAGKGSDIAYSDVFEDTEGHAHQAYRGPDGLTGLFAVRPDGVVGARAGRVETLERYLKGIFSQS